MDACCYSHACHDGGLRCLCSWLTAFILQELDPSGKFESQSSVWRWRALFEGVQVPYWLCCTPDGGFSSQCQCGAAPSC